MDREEAWADMMRAASRGDRAAYERFLAEVAPWLRRVVGRTCARHGGRPCEVEDVVQEALIALHCKRHTWEEDRPILPWINAIARHKALDAARRSGRARRGVVDARPEELADLLPAPEPRGHWEVAGLLGRLPERQRGVVRALALEGKSVGAVAQGLGVGDGAVRVAFHRGLAALRRMVG